MGVGIDEKSNTQALESVSSLTKDADLMEGATNDNALDVLVDSGSVGTIKAHHATAGLGAVGTVMSRQSQDEKAAIASGRRLSEQEVAKSKER